MMHQVEFSCLICVPKKILEKRCIEKLRLLINQILNLDCVYFSYFLLSVSLQQVTFKVMKVKDVCGNLTHNFGYDERQD